MVQVPLLTKVTVLPETVQIAVLSDCSSTGSPELALAVTANGAAPKIFAGTDTKVMVWLDLDTGSPSNLS